MFLLKGQVSVKSSIRRLRGCLFSKVVSGRPVFILSQPKPKRTPASVSSL